MSQQTTTPVDIRSVEKFNAIINKLFKRFGFSGDHQDQTTLKGNLFRSLFGVSNVESSKILKSPASLRAVSGRTSFESLLAKFTIKEVTEFLTTVKDFKIRKHVGKAIQKAIDVVDFQLLNRYITKLQRIEDFLESTKLINLTKHYNLETDNVGSLLSDKLEKISKTLAAKIAKKLVVSPLQAMLRIATSVFNNPYLVGISSFVGYRAILGSIPCVLGVFPLKHVRTIELARSGKILKFRASGSVFLANQEGGKDAIRIEGQLYKNEQPLILMLWFLFLYGRGQLKSLDLNSVISLIPNVGIKTLTDILFGNADLQKPSYEYHRTFPFVTRHFIIPNCYIETVTFEDKLPKKDILQYTVLLRTYEKQPYGDFFYKNDAQSKELGVASALGIKQKNIALFNNVVEFAVNAGWRTYNSAGILADEQEWKLGSAIKTREATGTDNDLIIAQEVQAEAEKKQRIITRREQELGRALTQDEINQIDASLSPAEKKKVKDQVLGSVYDTYYDVDPTSLASVVFLSIMGAI